MTYEWNDIIPLFFVLLVGVPHGAADSLLAMKVYRLQSFKKLMFFLISYIVLVGMTLLAWVYYPLLSLLAFLFISALHFGLGDLSMTLPHLSQDQPVQKGLIAWCQGGSLIFNAYLSYARCDVCLSCTEWSR